MIFVVFRDWCAFGVNYRFGRSGMEAAVSHAAAVTQPPLARIMYDIHFASFFLEVRS